MRTLQLPPKEEIDRFLMAVSERDPGLGIVDLVSGRIYLAYATALAGGDHASLVERALGIMDIEDARHVRGFVIGKSTGELRIVNLSGLNPLNNQMEPDVFNTILDLFQPLIRPMRRE